MSKRLHCREFLVFCFPILDLELDAAFKCATSRMSRPCMLIVVLLLHISNKIKLYGNAVVFSKVHSRYLLKAFALCKEVNGARAHVRVG